MMKKIILFCFAGTLILSANAQTFYNNGAIVSVTTGGVMIVKTDSVTQGSGSLENHGSATETFKNAGSVTVQGSFIIDQGAEADGAGVNTGQYWVQADWNNSGTFTADNSTVYLYGSLPQNIIGDSTTTFYNLNDTMAGIKTQGVDANVSNVLTLAPFVEHTTADFNLTILNADPAAIVPDDLNSSFVNSTGPGRLIRNTNQKAEYIFPTGIVENGTAKIREISVTPANSTALFYRARFADDAGSQNTTTTDGYNVNNKGDLIESVNNTYYHLLTASNNTVPADLAIYYDRAYDDSAWTGIARWQVVPQWQNLMGCVVLPDARPNPSSRLKVVKAAWNPTGDSAFALIDTIAVAADFAFPNAFVGDCRNCSGSSANDGDNGAFGIINAGGIVTLEELSVFNRWGEMVFDSKRDGAQDWYGHFHGKLQPEGNYVYRAVVRNNSTGKQYPLVTGNVSLLW